MRFYIAATLFLTGFSVFAADIHLELIGCTAGKDVRVALYSSPSGFSEAKEGNNAFRTQVLKAERDSLTLSFTDLPAGKYAVAAFVDSNGNHKLDSNFLGIPTEPYGFSRDARNPFKSPSFEEAAFEVGNENVSQIIHLK
jgi:uncharacterized protein (DUF2141 family)